MADVITLGFFLFMTIMLIINTVFSLKGTKGIKNSLENINNNIKKFESSGFRQEPEKCPKCKKTIDEHTLAEAKKCGLIRAE